MLVFLLQFKLAFKSHKTSRQNKKTTNRQNKYEAEVIALEDAFKNLSLEDTEPINVPKVIDSSLKNEIVPNDATMIGGEPIRVNGNSVFEEIDDSSEEENATRFEVEKIVNHRLDDYGHRMYDIEWAAGAADGKNERTWEFEENFDTHVPIIEYYANKVILLTNNIRDLRQKIQLKKNAVPIVEHDANKVNSLAKYNRDQRREVQLKKKAVCLNENDIMDHIVFLCDPSEPLPLPMSVKIEPLPKEIETNDNANVDLIEVDNRAGMDNISGSIPFQV